jgi:two-component system NtrC family sensor kinase
MSAPKSFLDGLDKGGCTDQSIAKAREFASATDIDFICDEVPLAIEQSIDGIKQMAEIVGAMKEFSHPKLNVKSIIDVNHALERATIISRSEWKDTAVIAWELQPGTVNAYLNEAELNQVFLNIIINAAHAIMSAEWENGEIRIATRSTDKSVHISISDNGIGIPKQNRDKVFEQFFTTKGVGKGTGQGLAHCHDVVVNRYKGRLYFNSKPGRGTTFHIELPKQSN